MTPEAWIGIVVGLAASVEDVVWRRISNWTSGAALLAGFATHLAAQGWPGLARAAWGTAAGFGVFFVFYLLSGMGGGDVKLMAGFGALLGIPGVFYAALLAAVAGALLAMAVLAVFHLRRRNPPKAIPYAPAIVLGAWLALFSGV